jgi:hypothetical protein
MKFLGLEFFTKDAPDPSVLVPLAQAKRHSTVEADYARRRSEEGHRVSNADDKDPGAKKDGSDSELGRADSPAHSMYSIEGLREECMRDVVASGQDSSYDCECATLNRETGDANCV